ncbi:SCP2 sterol-binding domain-containing protein [Actinoplanes sp. NPDC049316]|uniref:SCP2 sterol-binding domain-containing protein n=1 Tax=Actinoplanes sp. NPDC049316 TaxID=3154727 RepID=UPI003434428C
MIEQDERLRNLTALIDNTPHDDLEAAVGRLPGGADEALDLIFTLLASEFNPQKAKGKRGVFQFEITDGTGVREHYVHVENDTCTTGRGKAEKPDITLGVKLADMLLMGMGKLPGAKAFMTGKLKIRGNPLFGTKLGDWFDHPPA